MRRIHIFIAREHCDCFCHETGEWPRESIVLVNICFIILLPQPIVQNNVKYNKTNKKYTIKYDLKKKILNKISK